MSDEELYELVRENYVKENSDYLKEQLNYCAKKIKELSDKGINQLKENLAH